MIDWSKHIEIMSLKEHIHNYADQTLIDKTRTKKFLAALLNYDLDIPTLIRFVSGKLYRGISKHQTDIRDPKELQL